MKEAFYNSVGDYFTLIIIVMLIFLIIELAREIDREREKTRKYKQAFKHLAEQTKYEVVAKGDWTGYDLQ